MLIQASILGAISDPNQWHEFSCIKPGGKLDAKKFEAYVRLFANSGANCTRELPFLVTDRHYTGNTWQRNFLPFKWNTGLGVYNLDVYNPVYFENLKRMIKIANRYNMAFQFSIFDRCHGASLPESPWNKNQQGLFGYYHWNDYTRRYVEQVIQTVQEAKQEMWNQEGILCRVMFELENEPMNEGFLGTAMETLKLLLANGVKKEEIEDGVSYLPYENGRPVIRLNPKGELIRGRLFEKLKKAKKAAGLYPGDDKQDKTRYFSTIHQIGVNPRVLREMKAAMEHTRRLSLSCDGEKPKPGAAEWRERCVDLFSAAKWRDNKRKHIENWKFEHIYRGNLNGHSDFGDALDGVRGISEAYYQVFGEWPENYGKYPEVITGPGPIEAPGLQQQIDELRRRVEQNTREIKALKQR